MDTCTYMKNNGTVFFGTTGQEGNGNIRDVESQMLRPHNTGFKKEYKEVPWPVSDVECTNFLCE